MKEISCTVLACPFLLTGGICWHVYNGSYMGFDGRQIWSTNSKIIILLCYQRNSMFLIYLINK